MAKHPFPSSTKCRVDLFFPQLAGLRVSPERSLTYSPEFQGSCKRKPLPPGSPFLDFGTRKLPSHPQRKLQPPSEKLSWVLFQHVCPPPPTQLWE